MSPNTSKEGSQLEPEILSVPGLAKSTEAGLGMTNFLQPPIQATPSSDPNNWFNRSVNKLIAVIKWVIKDFKLRHLVGTSLRGYNRPLLVCLLNPFLLSLLRLKLLS